jgi:ABC-type thiamine transport system ATPase subunit
LTENLGVIFLADILPIFESGENRDQRQCLLVGDSGRNPTGRMRSAIAGFLMPAGGQLASERDVNAATPLKATSRDGWASS